MYNGIIHLSFLELSIIILRISIRELKVEKVVSQQYRAWSNWTDVQASLALYWWQRLITFIEYKVSCSRKTTAWELTGFEPMRLAILRLLVRRVSHSTTPPLPSIRKSPPPVFITSEVTRYYPVTRGDNQMIDDVIKNCCSVFNCLSLNNKNR